MNTLPGSDERETVLIVDDMPDNIALLSALLRDRYRVKVATSGEKALQVAAAAPQPDLVLLDVVMPGLDGHETCRRLKADPATAGIPVMFLTARVRPEDEEAGLRLGAADYITKPISPAIVLARVATQLSLRRAQLHLADQNRQLEQMVAERTRHLLQAQEATILALAAMAQTRDNESGNHMRRLPAYVAALAGALQHHPRFSAALADENIALLCQAAPLHDIGKIGIPDRILGKPGRLDPDEREIMKRYTLYGRDAIAAVEQQLRGNDRFLGMAREIACSHQEKWDGSGYPQGLKGEAIPVPARIVAVADVYDALASRRPYKPAYPHEEAVAIMKKGRGSQFDPDVLDAFLRIEEDFAAIARRYPDPA